MFYRNSRRAQAVANLECWNTLIECIEYGRTFPHFLSVDHCGHTVERRSGHISLKVSGKLLLKQVVNVFGISIESVERAQ
jgi:hypothetical protein